MAFVSDTSALSSFGRVDLLGKKLLEVRVLFLKLTLELLSVR